MEHVQFVNCLRSENILHSYDVFFFVTSFIIINSAEKISNLIHYVNIWSSGSKNLKQQI